MKTFICRTSQAEDVAKHLSSYYPHEFTADGTKVFCEENLKDDEWLNEIKEHARGYFQGIVDTLASSDLAALRAERDELLKHLADALDDNYWHAEGCRGDNACVCWVSKSRAVLAKYEAK